MILPRLWISLPCLSTSMISLSRPSFCVLRTFLRLFNAMLLSRMISWLYFLMSSLAFFFMVLHITLFGVYRRCFPPFLVVSSSELVTLSLMCEACWFPQPLLARFICVMVSLMVSMSSSSCSVSNPFLNSSWNSIFFYPICAAFTLGGLFVVHCFLSTYTSSFMLLTTIL
ncbi:hypothetical protein NP493_848g03070 [Ridgeia piscesae]|uniref:Uncharacterized protein n=1 Tax=Ridgeia piscesae TaxID=27915 RepID=A0AAD9KMC9_RIDPI|nr:hypothetical protein NP493_848g03070 [Ridgeia piscesae]